MVRLGCALCFAIFGILAVLLRRGDLILLDPYIRQMMNISIKALLFLFVFTHKEAAAHCADLHKDIDGCLAHKDLGVHACTYCVQTQECHAVGSPSSDCPNKCCASLASLSTCDFNDVDKINGAVCNGTWSVKTFAPGSDPSTTVWPEKGRTNGKGTALHFSGGGSRAMTMGIGQTRAFHQLGLLANVEYMVGVSGGGWFVSSFTYGQTAVDDETRLCPYVDPAAITDDNLNNIPEGCMLSAPRCHMYECIALEAGGAVLPGHKLDHVYVDCVHKCYLEPFGIGRTQLYSLAESDVNDIKERNPNIADETFLLPVDSTRPYMIIVGALVRPQIIGPLEVNRTFVPLELSALGSGISHTQTVDYAPKHKQVVPVKIGGMMESFGFAAAATTDGVDVDANGVGEGYVGVTALGDKLDRNSLALTAGISSMAPAALFAHYGSMAEYVLIGGDIWPADEGLKSYTLAKHNHMLFGDGGDFDNFGIFSSLRRRVPRLAIFVNTDSPLNISWDSTTRDPTFNDLDGFMSSLFGVEEYAESNSMFYMYNNQVFAKKDLSPIVQALQAHVKAGNAAVFTSTLTTIENKFMGIPAGLEVTILWGYSSLPQRWFDQLPLTIQHDLKKGHDGPYGDFPYLSIKHIALSTQQVNLLANLCTWSVLDNKEQFERILTGSCASDLA